MTSSANVERYGFIFFTSRYKMETATNTLWNSIAGVADDGVLAGTGITVGQEVIFSKIIRKMMRRDNKSWFELIMFSLMTAQTDGGLGAWLSKRKLAAEAGFTDVLMDAIRSVLSCIACNYVLRVSERGIHNPMRSFGFVDLLIMLASKDLAYGGKAVLAQNTDAFREPIANSDALFDRQTLLSRLLVDNKAKDGEKLVARKKAEAEA